MFESEFNILLNKIVFFVIFNVYDGDDYLIASNTNPNDSNYGHDVLIGGKGDDTLVGNLRNSTYIYNYDDGDDTIIDGGNVGATDDILEFRDLNADDVVVQKSGNDLVINVKDLLKNDGSFSGSVTIKNGLSNGKMEKYVFADTTLDFNGILNVDDVYLFEEGMGEVFIYDSGSRVGDKLEFSNSLTQDDIIIQAVQGTNSLIIARKEDGKNFEELSDKMTIVNWFNPSNTIETFSFTDGVELDIKGILLAQRVDDEDNFIRLNGERNSLDAQGGDDTIVSDSSSYTIDGGLGDDTVNTSSGDDTLIGGAGNDTIGDTGAVQRIKLNPYQTMMSGYDANHDAKITNKDAIYSYMYRKVNADGSITLYLPDNEAAKAMIKDYVGNESIQSSLGDLTIQNIIFYQGDLELNNEITGITCRELKIVNNIYTCRLHTEQIKQNKREVA